MDLKNYITSLESSGTKIYSTVKDYFWMTYEKKAAARSPAFILSPVEKNEIEKVFEELKPIFVTYNIEAAESDSNAVLYVSDNTDYDIELLERRGRRYTRTGLKNFEFKFISWEKILEYGFQPYADTRERNGLSDGTRQSFNKIFTDCKANPAFKALAALKPGDETVYAFLFITEVEDWVEITSAYSRNDYLKYCPNNGLFHTAFEYYLKEKRARIISYGVSSIQKASKKDTLHEFKIRLGFEAVPIKRIFAVNPKYKPFINKYSYSIVKALLKIFPHERRINKLEGVMSLLNEKS